MSLSHADEADTLGPGLLPGTETRGISPPSHQSLHRTGGLLSEAKRRRVLILLKPPDLGYEVI